MLTKDLAQSCKSCATTVRVRGNASDLLACPKCGAIITNETGNPIVASTLPDDLSFLQIGLTGTHEQKSFEIIGRASLRMDRNYITFWCLWIEKDSTYAWLADSLGTYTYCSDSFFMLTDSPDIAIGQKLKVTAKSTVDIDAVEKCREDVRIAGELKGWREFKKGLTMAAGNGPGNLGAFYFYRDDQDDVRFLVGQWADFDDLKFSTLQGPDAAKTPVPDFTCDCPQCKKKNVIRGRKMTRAKVCSSCGIYFTIGWENDFKFKNEYRPALAIGSFGEIDGHVFEVLGFAVKQARKDNYRWREYFLFSPKKGIAYLSEYDGHWNFILPIREDPNPKRRMTFEYNDYSFRLYQKFKTVLAFAQGEFFADMLDVTNKAMALEYIAPPYFLGYESDNESRQWYMGEYMPASAIASAFKVGVGRLPKTDGRGYTQPVLAAFHQQTLISLCFVLIVLVGGLQFLFEKAASEKVVYQRTFYAADFIKDQRMFVTPSFTVEGSTKSLVVNLSAPISNDWFYGDFTLIDEVSQIEYNFSKEIEYYYGTTDGESWSEGSNAGEAYLSKIPAGRYHINIYPEFSPSNSQFSISVTRDVASFSNMWITLLIIAVFPAYYFIRSYFVERNRWSDSDYSPYDDD